MTPRDGARDRSSDKISIERIILIITFIIACASPVLTLGDYRGKLIRLESRAEAQEQEARVVSIKLERHDTVIPTIQQDVRDLKSGQDEMRSDIKLILRAVNK